MEIHLSENLKTLRRNKNATQEQLSVHLGITVQAVSKWDDCVKQGLTILFGSAVPFT